MSVNDSVPRTNIDIAVDEGWEELEDSALGTIRIVMRARFSDDPIANLKMLQALGRSLSADAEKMQMLLQVQKADSP